MGTMIKKLTVHDEFITSILQNLFYARRFLKRALKKHSRHIDWKTLKLADNSYVRDNLKRYIADVVFTVQYKNGTTLNLLLIVEHKSYVPGTALPIQIQLLGYLLARYEQYLAQYKEQRKQAKDKGEPAPEFKLPVVIPIVVYHGKRKWKPRSWWKLFGKKELPQALKTYVPYFEYELLDYNRMTDDELNEHYDEEEDLKLIAKLMKHV
ncbi:MAG: Rpn family recombination-promoting nuclease/putative transposase, partial [Cyanobacteria bacterium P01_H01_bin.74]